MNINIYEKYKIKIINEYSYLCEDNETIYDNYFKKEKQEKIIEIDGGKLLNIINQKLQEEYLSEFVIFNNELHFEYFNYNTGESSHDGYIILSERKK